MKQRKAEQQKQKQKLRLKISFAIKLIVSAVLIYLVLTDGGRSSISQTLGLGGAADGSKTENIFVIAFLGVYIVMLIINAIRRFRAQSGDEKQWSGKRLQPRR